jgi:hypothetical protein
LDGTTIRRIQNAIHKRSNLLWISIALSVASIALNVTYKVLVRINFADYYRFEYSFADEIRWNYMRLLLPDELLTILELWKKYVK